MSPFIKFVQLVQIGLQWRIVQYLTIACPYDTSQQVEMHLQIPQNKFAYGRQIGIQVKHMKHIKVHLQTM